MKTVSRNKFLLCFRPVADMDLVIEAEGVIDRSTKNQALKYISESTYQTCSKGSDNSSMIACQPSHRALSKAKGVRDRKSLTQELYQSKRIFSRKKYLDDKSSLLRNTCYDTDHHHHHLQDQTKWSRPVLSSQSSFRSTSPCTSTSSTILLESKRQNQNKKNQKEQVGSSSSSFNYAIWLLLLSLTVTILWGRVCAILFTSIWLYFLPQQQSGWRSENEKELSRSESLEITTRKVS